MKINAGHTRIGGFFDKLKIGYAKGGISPGFWLYRMKWHLLPRMNYVPQFPLHIIIETTNVCNLKCIMCYSRYTKLNYGYMGLETFKRLIDECASYKVPSLKISYGGEPLIHPNFLEMLEYASKKNVFYEMSFLTNATLLTKEKTDRILDLNLSEVIFSVDAFKKETYERIRVNSSYETVMNNINYFLDEKKRRGLKTPLVRIQLVKLKFNKDELGDFVTYWKPKVDYITMNDFIRPHGCVEDFSIDGIYSKGNAAAPCSIVSNSSSTKGEVISAEKTSSTSPASDTTAKYVVTKDAIIKDTKPSKSGACSALWQRIAILWDGEVVVCNGELKIGKNINTSSIAEIWHSAEFNHVRNLHSKGQAELIPHCKVCGFRELV